MQHATDEQLIAKAKRDRSECLARIYQDVGELSKCTCEAPHRVDNRDCPKVIWNQAARMALLFDGE